MFMLWNFLIMLRHLSSSFKSLSPALCLYPEGPNPFTKQSHSHHHHKTSSSPRGLEFDNPEGNAKTFAASDFCSPRKSQIFKEFEFSVGQNFPTVDTQFSLFQDCTEFGLYLILTLVFVQPVRPYLTMFERSWFNFFKVAQLFCGFGGLF